MDKSKSITKFLIMIIALWLIYISILAFGHMIPKNFIQNNLSLSYKQIYEEGLYPSFGYSSWDNWTDAIFINSIATDYDGNLLEQVVANAYTISTDNNSEFPGHFSILNGDLSDSSEIVTYARYWAGNYTLYKLLLFIMPLNKIRILLLCITICLLIGVCFCIYRLYGIKNIIPFLLILELKIGLKSSMCLTYNSDIILMLIGIIICYILYKKNLFKYYPYLFFLVGSLSAYLGYWAFPLITLAMPLIFMTGIYQRNKEHTKLLLFIIKQSIMWCIGLGSTVIAKTILSICVLEDGTGISQMLFRLGENVSISDRIVKLFRFVEDEFFFNDTPPLICITVLSITGLAYMVRTTKDFGKKFLPYLTIAAYPFIWSLITIGHIGHGFDHFYFCVFYFALTSFVCLNINLSKITVFINRKDIFVLLCYCTAIVLFFSLTIKYKPKQMTPYAMNTLSETRIGGGVIQEFELLDRREKYLDSIQSIFICDDDNGTVSITFMDGTLIKKRVDVPVASILSNEWTEIPVNILVEPNHTYQIKYTTDVQNENLALLTEASSEANPFNLNCFTSQGSIADKVVNIYEYQATLDTTTRIYASAAFLFVLQIIISIIFKKNVL